jgi:tetratricopeptide (TPR) repeat protein
VAANNLAWIYADSGEHLQEALQYAKAAAQALPGVPETHDTLGWVNYKLDMPERAAAAFREAIKLAPRNPSFHYRLGLALAKTGETIPARAALERALVLDPAFREAADARAAVAALNAPARAVK